MASRPEASPETTLSDSASIGNGDEIVSSEMTFPAGLHIHSEAAMKPTTKRAVLHLAEAAWRQMKEQEMQRPRLTEAAREDVLELIEVLRFGDDSATATAVELLLEWHDRDEAPGNKQEARRAAGTEGN